LLASERSLGAEGEVILSICAHICDRGRLTARGWQGVVGLVFTCGAGSKGGHPGVEAVAILDHDAHGCRISIVDFALSRRGQRDDIATIALCVIRVDARAIIDVPETKWTVGRDASPTIGVVFSSSVRKGDALQNQERPH